MIKINEEEREEFSYRFIGNKNARKLELDCLKENLPRSVIAILPISLDISEVEREVTKNNDDLPKNQRTNLPNQNSDRYTPFWLNYAINVFRGEYPDIKQLYIAYPKIGDQIMTDVTCGIRNFPDIEDRSK